MARSNPLFTPFPAVPTSDWLEEIKRASKGALPEWEPAAGLSVAGAIPIERGAQSAPVSATPGWTTVTPCIDPGTLEPGETGLLLDVGSTPVNALPENVSVLPSALDAVRYCSWMDAAENRSGHILFDPFLGSLLTDEAFDPVEDAVTLDCFSMDGTGIGPVTSIAWALYSLDCHLQSASGPSSIPIPLALTAIRTEFIAETARLRALRICLGNLLNRYGCNPGVRIHTVTSGLANPPHDPDTNLIRSSIQAAAAIAGCTNLLTVLPHDFHDGGLERRPSIDLALGVSRLLEHEAFLAGTADPLGGSAVLETVTDRFVEAAWNRFLEMKPVDHPGILISSGLLPAWIRADREHYLQAGRRNPGQDIRTMVGVNRYGPSDGKARPTTYFPFPFGEHTSGPCPELSPWRPFE